MLSVNFLTCDLPVQFDPAISLKKWWLAHPLGRKIVFSYGFVRDSDMDVKVGGCMGVAMNKFELRILSMEK